MATKEGVMMCVKEGDVVVMAGACIKKESDVMASFFHWQNLTRETKRVVKYREEKVAMCDAAQAAVIASHAVKASVETINAAKVALWVAQLECADGDMFYFSEIFGDNPSKWYNEDKEVRSAVEHVLGVTMYCLLISLILSGII